MTRRRSATYVATLIHLDEPQLLVLKSSSITLLAVAVPDSDKNKSMFLAVTVSPTNFERYLDGNSDLRYLFTYPKSRVHYLFDLMKMSDRTILMDPVKKVDEALLPAPRIFSTDHTHEYEHDSRADDKEKLFIDGEWDMPEFGQFYQRYSEVYAFAAATINWEDDGRDQPLKRRLVEVFRDKPYKGGFSYVHFYEGLSDNLPRDQRIGLDAIQYASPGTVDIVGQSNLLKCVENAVSTFLDHREDIDGKYLRLRKYLSENRLLKTAGERYPKNDPTARFIKSASRQLNDAIGISDFDAVHQLSGSNALVSAKIILSLYRRVEEAAKFFAQGRMSYQEPET